MNSVNFARSGGNTRSFDFEVELKSGTVHTFSSIEKEEYGKLFDFITSKKLNVKNRGKNVSYCKADRALLIFLFFSRTRRRTKTMNSAIQTMKRNRMHIWKESRQKHKKGMMTMTIPALMKAPTKISNQTQLKVMLLKNLTVTIAIQVQMTNQDQVMIKLLFYWLFEMFNKT